jgi:chemosensory pili system protein ChpA (sensor histidine kinase/response regulator)
MKKILIVDDDSSMRELLENRLRSNGYDVVEASNGVGAFVQTIDEKPDLILLDVNMPVMDGYKFVQTIRWREQFKDIPILVVSGRLNTRGLFREMGITHFLSKPFRSEELLEMVEESIKNPN